MTPVITNYLDEITQTPGSVHPQKYKNTFLWYTKLTKLTLFPYKPPVNSGLSMNILRAGDKSPVQRGFFKNSAGDLLPAIRFLAGLCNFCNYIFFNHNGM